jgi:pyochelin biosynthesis protein PchC
MNEQQNGCLRSWAGAGQPRLRLVCFPHAGGGASFFRSWAHETPSNVEMCSVQYPGREDRINDAFAVDIHELVRSTATALSTFHDAPAVLFGHSMGAIVAFEVARSLQCDHGRSVQHLFVSAQPAPHLKRTPSSIHLGDDRAVLEELRRVGYAPNMLSDHPELRDLVFPAVRNDYRIVHEHRPAQHPSPLECPITAVIGDTDPDANQAEMMGWSGCTRGEFDLKVFTGGHFYLLANRSELIQEIFRRLSSVSRDANLWLSTP